MKVARYFLAVAAMTSVVACTDSADTPRDDRDTKSIMSKDVDDKDKESYQQPGQIDKVETSKGSAEVETRKQIVTNETDRERIPVVEEKHIKADINRLSTDEFMKLGLARDVADKVVQYRKEHGNFRSVEDLKKVPGMSTAWISQMRNQLGFSG